MLNSLDHFNKIVFRMPTIPLGNGQQKTILFWMNTPPLVLYPPNILPKSCGIF